MVPYVGILNPVPHNSQARSEETGGKSLQRENGGPWPEALNGSCPTPDLALFGDCSGVARGTCNFLALAVFLSLALSQHLTPSPGPVLVSHVGEKRVPAKWR